MLPLLLLMGKKVVHATSSLSLNDVLFALKFHVSLLSISKITTQNRYHAIFYPSYCVFHNLQNEMKIGLEREYGGLYYLNDGILHSVLAAISPFNTYYNGIIGWDILPCKSYVKYCLSSLLLLL